MNKESCYKFIWGVSILLVLAFLVFLAIDYCKYNSANSAPFYPFVIARALEFLLPSFTVFVIGIFCKRKFTK